MAHNSDRFTRIQDALKLNIYASEETSVIEKALVTLARHPDVQRLAPEAKIWLAQLSDAKTTEDLEEREYALLELYRTLHTAGSGYSHDEKQHLKSQKGLHGLSGGFLPLFMARALITPSTCLADLGAGNGLQGLLLQCLAPHAHTLQVELSQSHLAAGRLYQQVLGIPAQRISWVHGDLFTADLSRTTLVYLYRPVRPSETTLPLYQTLAATLEAVAPPLHIVSVADCLMPHIKSPIPPLYSDGFITIAALYAT